MKLVHAINNALDIALASTCVYMYIPAVESDSTAGMYMYTHVHVHLQCTCLLPTRYCTKYMYIARLQCIHVHTLYVHDTIMYNTCRDSLCYTLLMTANKPETAVQGCAFFLWGHTHFLFM